MPGLLVAVIATQACGPARDTVGPPLGATFALTLGATSVSLAQGGTASTYIMATRTGTPTGVITYTLTGAPAGLTASVVGTSVPDSSTLTVAASATLAPATYPLVLNAAMPGAPAQQVPVVVTVRVPADGGPAVSAVVVGAHTCALTTAGSAYCWGYNGEGQLGNGSTSVTNPMPVAVAGGLAFQSLSVSKVNGVSCGLATSGKAYCWGRNDEGELGDGTTTDRATPTPVAGGLSFMSLAVGTGHVCGIATDGTAYCWGSTTLGAFGDGSVGRRLTPRPSAPGITFERIVAGHEFTCGLTPAGAAYCWGRGQSGQLGDGNHTTSTLPVAVSGGLTFRSLAAAGLTACGLTDGGQAYCWGYNFFGTVGDGTGATEDGTTRRIAPVAVAGGLTFRSLGAGYETVCGVSDAGNGYCWGYSFGAVGDGTPDHRSIPTAVAGGLTFKGVSAGTGYSCGVTTGNAVYCWGDNSNGQLGDGTTTSTVAPVPVRWP